MVNIDALFEASLVPVGDPRSQPIALRSTDRHNEPNFITDEGFLAAFYRGDFIVCVRDRFQHELSTPTSLDSISYHLPSCEIVRHVEAKKGSDLLVKGSDWWSLIGIRESFVYVEFGANSIVKARDLAKRFRKGLIARDIPETTVKFQVWAGEEYPSIHRFEGVSWQTIKCNYSQTTRDDLSGLMSYRRKKPSSDGRIILFHGPPGTGKTWAIKSLLTSWDRWAKASLILDVENLLNSPAYLLRVVDQAEQNAIQVIVIEDAQARTFGNSHSGGGDGVTQLLSITDGILTSENEVVLLISTNAEPNSLNPALLRPGRCLSSVKFDSIPANEANILLGSKGSTTLPLTLAEIYRQRGESSLLRRQPSPLTGQYL